MKTYQVKVFVPINGVVSAQFTMPCMDAVFEYIESNMSNVELLSIREIK